jgi:DNA polymerase-3 subunit epsilon
MLIAPEEPSVNPAHRRAQGQARRILQSRPLFLDTETTGLGSEAQIVEIALVDPDGSVLFESLVRPLAPIPPDATAIHGITNAMVAGAPDWRSVWSKVGPLLTGERIAIYNAEFDLRMMRSAHRRAGLAWTLPSDRFVCLMELYAEFRGDWNPIRRSYRWHSLEAAAQQCALPLANRHRAAQDAALARQLLEHMAGEPLNPAAG